MNKDEALQQISVISAALESSNRVVFSWLRMIVFGLYICLIPLLEWGFSHLLALSIWSAYTKLLSINLILHIAFYWGLAYLLGKLMNRYHNGSRQITDHPMLQKAFAIARPIFFCIIGCIVVFSFVGRGELIFPVVFLLLGILFNLYGRFTIKLVRIVSQSYFVLGFVYAGLVNLAWPYLWIPFTIYLGLSYLMMGIFLRRDQLQHD